VPATPEAGCGPKSETPCCHVEWRQQNNLLMNTLNLIYLNLIQLVRQAWLLPQTVASVFKQRRLELMSGFYPHMGVNTP
jgi:hypothetical protein